MTKRTASPARISRIGALLRSTSSTRGEDLVIRDGDVADEVNAQAIWEVFFTRLGAIQEYGWHAGVEELLWASDYLGDALITLDWTILKPELSRKRANWMSLVIDHAKENGVFFDNPTVDEELNDAERR